MRITGLGIVAAGKRSIRGGNEFEKYFNRSEHTGKEVQLKAAGDTFDTIVLMKDMVLKNKHQTAKIAKTLKGKTREESCRNIWNWVYNHFQYSLDSAAAEQLRTPLRSWVDRKKGIDCDCMSILISSILSNLAIPHALRKTKYSGKDYFQHIYVVVPSQGNSIGSQYITIDAVVDRFNYEVPFSAKHDLMMPINQLSGLGSVGIPMATHQSHSSFSGLAGIVAQANPHRGCFCHEFNGLGAVPGVAYTPEVVEAEFLIRLKEHLQNTLTELKRNPGAVKDIGKNPSTFRNQLELLISSWDDASLRGQLLEQLEALETSESQMNGFGSLGGFFSKIKSAVKKVGSAVSNTAKKVGTAVAKTASTVARKVGSGVSSAARAVSNTAKTVAKAVVKYNPLSVLIRNGLLLALKINLFKMSERLGYGLWTEGEARLKGLDITQWRKVKSTYDKALKVFLKLEGSKDSFDKNLKQGWDHGTKKHGLLRGLGEPATVAGTAAASGVIGTILAWLSKIDWKSLFKKLINKPNYSQDDQEGMSMKGDGTKLPQEVLDEMNSEGYSVVLPNTNGQGASVATPYSGTSPVPAFQDGQVKAAGMSPAMLLIGASLIGGAIFFLNKNK